MSVSCPVLPIVFTFLILITYPTPMLFTFTFCLIVVLVCIYLSPPLCPCFGEVVVLFDYFVPQATKNNQSYKIVELGRQKASLKLGPASRQRNIPELAPNPTSHEDRGRQFRGHMRNLS